MNDPPALEQDRSHTWHGRANAYHHDRLARLRRLRQATIRREAQRHADSQDLLERLLNAWERLDERLPRVAQTLDLHYFGAFSTVDAAAFLGISLELSASDLRLGRAWLTRAAGQDSVSVHLGMLELRADPSRLTGPP